MDDIDYAYSAGLFDGEGSVLIHHSKYRPAAYSLRVQVANTHKKSMEFLKRSFGGSVREGRRHHVSRSGHKRVWVWSLSHKSAEAFLRKVHPFVKIKLKQVTLALKFREETTHKSGKKLSDSEIKTRAKYAKKMSWLNHGGNL